LGLVALHQELEATIPPMTARANTVRLISIEAASFEDMLSHCFHFGPWIPFWWHLL
jgi:hypothetical protein